MDLQEDKNLGEQGLGDVTPAATLHPLDKVYPSKENTVYAVDDGDTYGGAHEYRFRNSLGHIDGKPVYTDSDQVINFVKKPQDGSEMIPGLQSEQLLIALIDRHKKLNAAFGSAEGTLAIRKMQEALYWLEERVKERTRRGVMGQLKK